MYLSYLVIAVALVLVPALLWMFLCETIVFIVTYL